MDGVSLGGDTPLPMNFDKASLFRHPEGFQTEYRPSTLLVTRGKAKINTSLEVKNVDRENYWGSNQPLTSTPAERNVSELRLLDIQIDWRSLGQKGLGERRHSSLQYECRQTSVITCTWNVTTAKAKVLGDTIETDIYSYTWYFSSYRSDTTSLPVTSRKRLLTCSAIHLCVWQNDRVTSLWLCVSLFNEWG